MQDTVQQPATAVRRVWSIKDLAIQSSVQRTSGESGEVQLIRTATARVVVQSSTGETLNGEGSACEEATAALYAMTNAFKDAKTSVCGGRMLIALDEMRSVKQRLWRSGREADDWAFASISVPQFGTQVTGEGTSSDAADAAAQAFLNLVNRIEELDVRMHCG